VLGACIRKTDGVTFAANRMAAATSDVVAAGRFPKATVAPQNNRRAAEGTFGKLRPFTSVKNKYTQSAPREQRRADVVSKATAAVSWYPAWSPSEPFVVVSSSTEEPPSHHSQPTSQVHGR
jgi:hypothetical protein